jgi:hypothetical protein
LSILGLTKTILGQTEFYRESVDTFGMEPFRAFGVALIKPHKFSAIRPRPVSTKEWRWLC